MTQREAGDLMLLATKAGVKCNAIHLLSPGHNECGDYEVHEVWGVFFPKPGETLMPPLPQACIWVAQTARYALFERCGGSNHV